MRKTILICLMMLLIAPIAIEAEKKPFGYGLYWELTKQGELVISGKGAIPNFSYPHYKKFKTSGTAPWNQKKVWDKATRVIIQEGITEIGNNAFNGFSYAYKHASTNIRDIKIPSSVTRIGESAFAYSKISSFQFPKNTRIIGDCIFKRCRYLTSCSIPSNLIRVTSGLFYGCSDLSQVTIPEGVTEISPEAFRECDKLQSITLPKSLKKIGHHAFYGCYGLQALYIPDNVEEIGHYAFYHCHRLSKIQFPSKLRSIGDYAFCDCSITNVSLPLNLETIGKGAFSWNKRLLHVSMYDGVKTIGDIAFYSCSELKDIKISVNAKMGKESVGYSFNGIIYRLPNYVTKDNCIDYGISSSAFQKYANGENGIINSQGKMILEAKSGRRVKKKTDGSDNSVYYEIEDENGRGIMADNGQWIISTERGYNSISKITNAGKTYYKVSTRYGGPYGLLNSNGRVIIPVEYPKLDEAGGKYLRFKVGDFYGIMNYQGNVIIPTTKGYTYIGDYVSAQNSFTYTKYGYKGEVNVYGVELSKIKVETPKQQTVVKQETTTPKKEEKVIVVEHHRDPVPVQQWQACFACGGMGTMGCDNCGGSGTKYIGDRLHRCSRCNGQGLIPCNVCYGNKGQYITVYQ